MREGGEEILRGSAFTNSSARFFWVFFLEGFGFGFGLGFLQLHKVSQASSFDVSGLV